MVGWWRTPSSEEHSSPGRGQCGSRVSREKTCRSTSQPRGCLDAIWSSIIFSDDPPTPCHVPKGMQPWGNKDYILQARSRDGCPMVGWWQTPSLSRGVHHLVMVSPDQRSRHRENRWSEWLWGYLKPFRSSVTPFGESLTVCHVPTTIAHLNQRTKWLMNEVNDWDGKGLQS